MYEAALYFGHKADYTSEEIEDWTLCGDNVRHLADLITNLYFVVTLQM